MPFPPLQPIIQHPECMDQSVPKTTTQASLLPELHEEITFIDVVLKNNLTAVAQSECTTMQTTTTTSPTTTTSRTTATLPTRTTPTTKTTTNNVYHVSNDNWDNFV